MTRLLLFVLLAAAAFAQSTSGIDLQAIDRSADPCTDFYQFACGSWVRNNPVPPDQSRWSRFNELAETNRNVLRDILEEARPENAKRTQIERQIGDFYAACMNEPAIEQTGTAPLRAALARIAAIPTKFAMTEELIALHRQGIQPFFHIQAEQDAKDATRMIVGLDQGGLSLPDRDYYLNPDPKSQKLRDEFLAHIQRMFQLAGESPQSAAAKAQVVLKIETDLASRSLDRVSRRDPNRIYHKYTVPELISLAPGIDWQKYFAGMGVPAQPPLNVYYPPFVRKIEEVTVLNSLDNLKTYLSWNVLRESAPMLPAAFVQENWSFFSKSLSGAEQMRPRWKRCVDLTDDLLGDALGQKYVEKTFGEEGKKRTREMVQAIEAAMERRINSLEWMTPATRKQALAKLHSIANKIGFPDEWDDYSSVRIARDEALGNLFRLRQWAVEDDLRKVGKPIDRKEWGMSPPTVNAYYNPQMNDINFPAGILQPPFYGNKTDPAVNYGAIGSVIGHELTHGFDDEGRHFDAAGNLRDWWTPQDAKAFEDRAACIAEQYSQYTAVDDLKVNGKLTLGENVADNGGVRLAFMALLSEAPKSARLDGFSPEQRFYLGWGQIWCMNMRPEEARLRATVDPHSPGRYRVNGPLSNDPAFAKAFSCKPRQPMVRPKACRVW